MPSAPMTIENGVGGVRFGKTTPYAAVAIRPSGSKATSYPRASDRTASVLRPDGSHDETAITRTSGCAVAHVSSSCRFAMHLTSHVGPKNVNSVVRGVGPAIRFGPVSPGKE